MTIKLINPEPDPSVLKQVICRKCGVKLEYAPIDVVSKEIHDYGGGSDIFSYIKCPNCQFTIEVTRR